MKTSYETISDRGASRTSPLQSAAEMQQEVHVPAVSSFSDQILIIQNSSNAQELNEAIRKSSLSCFSIIQGEQSKFVQKSLQLLSKKDRTGLVVRHSSQGIDLCVGKAAWKYLRGFDESLTGEALVSNFVERAVLQREFTIVEFFE